MYSLLIESQEKKKKKNQNFLFRDQAYPVFHAIHYENTPIQMYWKFYHQKMKIFR